MAILILYRNPFELSSAFLRFMVSRSLLTDHLQYTSDPADNTDKLWYYTQNNGKPPSAIDRADDGLFRYSVSSMILQTVRFCDENDQSVFIRT